MSKICSKCGHVVDDSVAFCTACGEPMNVGEETLAQPAQNQADGGFDNAKEAFAKGFDSVKENAGDAVDKMKTKWTGLTSQQKMIGGGVAGVIVLILILAIALGGGGGYKSAVKNYVKIMEGSSKAFEKSFPKSVIEYFAEKEDKDVDEYMDEMIEDFSDKRHDEVMAKYEDEYGDKMKIKYEITKERELKGSKLNEVKGICKEIYGIPRKDVDEAYTLDVEFTYIGDDEGTEEKSYIALKIGGKWYLISAAGRLVGFEFSSKSPYAYYY